MQQIRSFTLKTNQKIKEDKNQYNFFFNNLFRLNPLNKKAENDFFTSLNTDPDADKLRVLILKFSLKPSDEISPIIFAVKSKNCLNLLIGFLQIIDDKEVFHKFINAVNAKNDNALSLFKSLKHVSINMNKIHIDLVNELIRFGINPLLKNHLGLTPRSIYAESLDVNSSINEIIKIYEMLYHENDKFDNSQSDEQRSSEHQKRIDKLNKHDHTLFIILKFQLYNFSYFYASFDHDKKNASELFSTFVDDEFGGIFHRIRDAFQAKILIDYLGMDNFKKHINQQNPLNGNTVLHNLSQLISIADQLKVFEILLENGADPRIKNSLQKEPELTLINSNYTSNYIKLQTLIKNYKIQLDSAISSESLKLDDSEILNDSQVIDESQVILDSQAIDESSIIRDSCDTQILSSQNWQDFPKFDEDFLTDISPGNLSTLEFPSSFFTNQDSLFSDDWFEKTLEASKKFNLGFEEHFNLQSRNITNSEESLDNLFDHAIKKDQTPQQDKEIQQDQLMDEEEISQRKVDDSINFNQHEMMVEEMNIQPSSDLQLTKNPIQPLVLNSKIAIINLVN